jgi:tetratricopeptide (TPR) repeat protein
MKINDMSLNAVVPEHLDTLTSTDNLASVLQSQGRWKEAEKLYPQVIEIRKRLLGAENRDTLMGIAYLATIYLGQGLLGKAEEIFKQTLDTIGRVLGAEHLMSTANLASSYRSQRRLKKVEESK